MEARPHEAEDSEEFPFPFPFPFPFHCHMASGMPSRSDQYYKFGRRCAGCKCVRVVILVA